MTRTTAVQLFHAQVYRLALLTVGDADAEQQVERAYATLDPVTSTTESDLVRNLLPQRRTSRPWRHNVGRAETDRAALDAARAQGLLDLLAQHTPLERLTIGLHTLRGLNADEVVAMLGEHAPPDVNQILAQFRIAAVGVLHPQVSIEPELAAQIDQWLDGRLDEAAALEVRRQVLADAEARDLRDALTMVRATLNSAIPALFAATPPHELTQRLFALAESERPIRRLNRGYIGLTLAVLVLIAAIILGPSLLAQGSSEGTEAPLSAEEIIDSALYRFERAEIDAGVLYERYLVRSYERDDYIIDRWYDYATPHRLRVSIRPDVEGAEPLAAIGSDGRNLVQYRFSGDFGWNRTRTNSFDVAVNQTEAQQLITLLRGGRIGGGVFRPADWTLHALTAAYLRHAREGQVATLGETTYLNRPAYLLTYQTEDLPNQVNSAIESWRVLLTIDMQTYALLEVALIPNGRTTSSTIYPLRAQAIELLPTLDNADFLLGETENLIRFADLASAHTPAIPSSTPVSLDELRRANWRLLVPQHLPEADMRSVALRFGNQDAFSDMLLYEGEYHSLVVSFQRLRDAQWRLRGEEFSAGEYRYQVVETQNQTTVTFVYRAERPDAVTIVVLTSMLADEEQRQELLDDVIASLTPVTTESAIIGHGQSYMK